MLGRADANPHLQRAASESDLRGRFVFGSTSPLPSTLGVQHAREAGPRAESAAGVKERPSSAFWTAFGRSLLPRGESVTETLTFDVQLACHRPSMEIRARGTGAAPNQLLLYAR